MLLLVGVVNLSTNEKASFSIGPERGPRAAGGNPPTTRNPRGGGAEGRTASPPAPLGGPYRGWGGWPPLRPPHTRRPLHARPAATAAEPRASPPP